MGIFGNAAYGGPSPEDLFSAPEVYTTPGIAASPFAKQGGIPIVEGLGRKGGGMFGRIGKSGVLPAILGIAGDYFSKQPRFGSMLAQQRMAEQQSQRDIQKATEIAKIKAQTPQMSTAARMAAEIGLQPGTPEYQAFIRRYAFKPTILQIPNAQGGTDYTEYDPSGQPPATGGLQPGYAEDGYVYTGGDPANPNSWSKQ